MNGVGIPKPEDLRNLLAATVPAGSGAAGISKAAVLILIYSAGSELFIPLTVRSNDLPLHAGQICLPGGCAQRTDHDLVTTALREAHEEIGVQLEKSSVLGCLPATTTNSGFEVTPVVAWASATPTFHLDAREVNKLIALPLELALDVSRYRQDSIIEKGLRREFYFIEFNEHYIWGATARMLWSLACLLR